MNLQIFTQEQFTKWLSTYERQAYYTFDVEPTEPELSELGFDLVSLKFDGQLGVGYVEQVDSNGSLHILLHSRTRQFKRRVVINSVPGAIPQGSVLFGESIVGTNWAVSSKWRDLYFPFDILTKDTQFSERAEFLRTVVRPYISWSPLRTFGSVLTYLQPERGDFEGVCFAQSDDRSPLPVFGRYKKGIELSGVIVGFDPGEGKYSGQVGSTRLRLVSGVVTTCSGFDDSIRLDMTQRPEFYLHKEVEITASRLFPSGLPRHPQFKRFK